MIAVGDNKVEIRDNIIITDDFVAVKVQFSNEFEFGATNNKIIPYPQKGFWNKIKFLIRLYKLL